MFDPLASLAFVTAELADTLRCALLRRHRWRVVLNMVYPTPLSLYGRDVFVGRISVCETSGCSAVLDETVRLCPRCGETFHLDPCASAGPYR